LIIRIPPSVGTSAAVTGVLSAKQYMLVGRPSTNLLAFPYDTAYSTFLMLIGDLLTPAEIHARAAAAGLTLNELAERANVTQTTFSHWKAGRHSISVATYANLLRVVRDAEEFQRQLGDWLGATPRPQVPRKLASFVQRGLPAAPEPAAVLAAGGK
jgi:transcriptional regulator with XRE-family HTH domain